MVLSSKLDELKKRSEQMTQQHQQLQVQSQQIDERISNGKNIVQQQEQRAIAAEQEMQELIKNAVFQSQIDEQKQRDQLGQRLRDMTEAQRVTNQQMVQLSDDYTELRNLLIDEGALERLWDERQAVLDKLYGEKEKSLKTQNRALEEGINLKQQQLDELKTEIGALKNDKKTIEQHISKAVEEQTAEERERLKKEYDKSVIRWNGIKTIAPKIAIIVVILCILTMILTYCQNSASKDYKARIAELEQKMENQQITLEKYYAAKSDINITRTSDGEVVTIEPGDIIRDVKLDGENRRHIIIFEGEEYTMRNEDFNWLTNKVANYIVLDLE